MISNNQLQKSFLTANLAEMTKEKEFQRHGCVGEAKGLLELYLVPDYELFL